MALPEPVRRRNSTYLALACANAVSQGSMTRKVRQMFENPPVKEVLPPLSRAEIQQSILANRMRRNSIQHIQHQEFPASNSEILQESIPASPPSPGIPAIPVVPTTFPAFPTASVFKENHLIQRCHNCSSILPADLNRNNNTSAIQLAPPALIPAKDNSNTLPSNEVVGDSKVECDGSEEPCSDESSSAVQSIANVPTNREVVAEELPKRDTVKKARSLFEKAGDSVEVYATLRPSSSTRMSHVKTNPSSRILRSESIPSILAEEMLMHKYRWPAGQQQKAGPASPTASPAHYRSNPSLCRNFSSRHSTDVDSLVSELSCDWSSDVESEASYASFSGRDPFPQGRKDDSDARYVSPQVLQKIRSYGMTLTFVNGRMIDGGDDDDTADYHSDDVVDHVIDRRLKRSDSKTLRSAGQSRPELIKVMNRSAGIKELKKKLPLSQPQKAHSQQKPCPKQPRIVACLPKSSGGEPNSNLAVRMRHSSGESSASSGVSSGRSELDTSSDDNSNNTSPFSSLKRHGSSRDSGSSDDQDRRSASPGPRTNSGAKSLASSPFGLYSVLYNFHHQPAAVPSMCV